MKDRILRIENLLLLVPLLLSAMAIYYLIQVLSQWYDTVKDGLSNAYESYLMGEQIIQCVFIILPGYLIHYFLRAIHKRNRGICFIHIIATTLLLIYWTWQTGFAVSVVPGWYIYQPLYRAYMGLVPMAVVISFWTLQITFVIYGLVIIHRWRKSMA